MTPDEVLVLFAARGLSTEGELVLRLAIATGLRREDLVGVAMAGVDAEKGLINYYEAKKKRTRTIPVGGDALRALRRWVGDHPREKWLFASKRSKSGHLSGRQAYDTLQDALKAAGLPSRTFHALRATCVKLAQRNGWKPEQVAELTGDKIETILAHYATPSRAEMQDVARDKPLV